MFRLGNAEPCYRGRVSGNIFHTFDRGKGRLTERLSGAGNAEERDKVEEAGSLPDNLLEPMFGSVGGCQEDCVNLVFEGGFSIVVALLYGKVGNDCAAR